MTQNGHGFIPSKDTYRDDTGTVKVWLGKITRCEFGRGGYDDAMFGVSFTIEGEYGIQDFWGWWGDRSERAEWTEQDWERIMVDTWHKTIKVLNDANVYHISKLIGKPVEVTTHNGTLRSWRILTEVI